MARLLMNMILIKHGYTAAIVPSEERNRYISSLEQADKSEILSDFIEFIAGCCKYALNLHLKAARGGNIEEEQDIDKEIVLFKRSLEKGPDDTIEARAYADQVLYPFFLYCKEKIEQFSDVFGSVHSFSDHSSLRNVDNQISTYSLSKRKSGAWPENAISISTRITFDLFDFQGKQNVNIGFRIENEADSDNCVWKFRTSDFDRKKEYTGQNLETLNKIFNEMVRNMMKQLSEISDARKLDR